MRALSIELRLASLQLAMGLMVVLASVDAKIYSPLHPKTPRSQDIPRTATGPLLLTPYILDGDIETARNLSRVVLPLSGLEASEQPDGYSGFLTVKERTNSNMFFWFVLATDVDPMEAPVVLWLQGGPGASSLFGMMEVNGPFSILSGEDGVPVPKVNPHAWTRKANVIYMDNPIGAGFSFTDSVLGLPTSDAEATEDLFEALVQWFAMFPEFAANQFFAFGESYAGKFVPLIGKRIHDHNVDPTSTGIKVNLAGLGIGDGFMSPPDSSIYADFLYQVSLVDAGQRDEMLRYEEDMKEHAAQGRWREAWSAWNAEFDYFMSRMGCNYVYDYTQCLYDPEEDDYEIYLNQKSTREAIHVGERPFGVLSGQVYTFMLGDFMSSARETIEFLLEHYKILMYDGNLDIICNHSGILEMFKAMTSWSGREEFDMVQSLPFYPSSDAEVAGSVKSVRNLRLVVIKNAGHMVPRSQPKHAYNMFNMFLDGSL